MGFAFMKVRRNANKKNREELLKRNCLWRCIVCDIV